MIAAANNNLSGFSFLSAHLERGRTIATNDDKRRWLKQSLKAKCQMLDQYEAEIERLEAALASLRGVADEISAGIERTQKLIDSYK